MKELKERELEEMPFDKAFETESGNLELCHATGIEVFFEGEGISGEGRWWNEYVDSDGNFHYGR